MQYYLTIWSLLFGLVIGSFLNVVIYRVPRRESLVRPGSHCPGCGMAIRWHDNIPVLSWLLLRGRCRGCGQPIAIRYPLVEALTGIGFLAAYLLVGIQPAVLLAWFVIAVIVTLAFIHHDHGVIPDRLALPAAAIGLASAIALDPEHWWYYLAGCAGTGILALLLSFLDAGLTGFSDAKVALLMGAVFGPYSLVAPPLVLVVRIVSRNVSSLCAKRPIKSKDGVGAVQDRQGYEGQRGSCS